MEGRRKNGGRERFEDALSLALKLEGWAIGQEIQAPSRSWKNKKTGSPLQASEGTQLC